MPDSCNLLSAHCRCCQKLFSPFSSIQILSPRSLLCRAGAQQGQVAVMGEAEPINGSVRTELCVHCTEPLLSTQPCPRDHLTAAGLSTNPSRAALMGCPFNEQISMVITHHQPHQIRSGTPSWLPVNPELFMEVRLWLLMRIM